jgi:hypothetical protein
MSWFEQLRGVLVDYYPRNTPGDVVGYLRGSRDPDVWRQMSKKNREQMIILGSAPPSDGEWAAAGVAHRDDTEVIHFGDLWGFIISYGGFMVTRPWGKISVLEVDLFRNYSVTLDQFRRSLPRAPRT